ncbi:hypothetical protein [Shewanella baltica]|uniref:hypothetical protein n=1 Tax=Shewanella baltica TaxID=62322 RepID=UPI003CFFB0B0
MIKQLNNIMVKAPFSLQARITIDADPSAERIILMHRDTCHIYYVFKPVTPITSFTVPFCHANTDTILVGILDDNRTYNCKFIDGVRAESVDGNNHG